MILSWLAQPLCCTPGHELDEQDFVSVHAASSEYATLKQYRSSTELEGISQGRDDNLGKNLNFDFSDAPLADQCSSNINGPCTISSLDGPIDVLQKPMSLASYSEEKQSATALPECTDTETRSAASTNDEEVMCDYDDDLDQADLDSEICSPRVPLSLRLVGKSKSAKENFSPRRLRTRSPSSPVKFDRGGKIPPSSPAKLDRGGKTPPVSPVRCPSGVSKFCGPRDAIKFTRERCFSTPPRIGVAEGRCSLDPTCSPVHSEREHLDHILRFGDILCVRGNNQLARIGGTGGVLGHVLLVTGTPSCMLRDSAEGVACLRLWPHVAAACIWRVPVVESTRDVAGLSESEFLLHVDPKTGCVLTLGELIDKDGVVNIIEFESEVPDQVEIWRSPLDLRKRANDSLMRQALADVTATGANWSWTTAVRAFLFDGKLTTPTQQGLVDDSVHRERTLQDIQECWAAEPICTSVVITFWQRYLCRLAMLESLPGSADSALALILEYMPLKADRVLPGELLAVLRSHNWENLARVPLAACHGSPPCMLRINSR